MLVVGAHPDDAELVAGGAIARLARAGLRVGIVDATRGEAGTRGDAATRAREADRAARILGVSVRTNLGLRDGHLEANEVTRRAVVEQIRALRPRIVIGPHAESRHPDHRVLSTVVRDACFLAGLRRWRASGAPWKPASVLSACAYLDVEPSLTVDISQVFRVKLSAIRAHRSQVAGARHLGDIPWTGRPLMDVIAIFHGYYGTRVGARFGEPFSIVDGSTAIRDLMTLATY
jgi:bacillithiol biosynthesis deacetylase BshB1